MITVAMVLMSSIAFATEVTFINNTPKTYLGLVKFKLDDNNKPNGYTILYERWEGRTKVLDLEEGMYVVTQYKEMMSMYGKKIQILTAYSSFWVYCDRPITVVIGYNERSL